MKILLVFYFSIFSINLFADNYIDSITLTKIKKLVQKEEEIALAYKEYLLKNGKLPLTNEAIDIKLLDLPKGFDTINPFGKQITLNIDNNSTPTNKKDDKHKIDGFKSTDPILKSNLYDYYYSNKYRTNTKAPISINNSDVEIILSSKEKFIYENSSNDSTLSKITTTAPDNLAKTPKNKYYLDNKGVLHWYDSNGNYKFSYDKELLLDESVSLLNTDGAVNSTYKDLVKDIEFAGMTILHKKDGVAQEYININMGNIIKVNQQERDIGKTVILFNRRAGGMIVNGDIYAWGNNGNAITGIDAKMTLSGKTSNGIYPLITVPILHKAKIYETVKIGTTDKLKYYMENYYSSPKRPKFIDLFAGVYTGTCGITTKGELYCGGTTGNQRDNNSTTQGDYTDVDKTSTGDGARKGELLYRSTYFDGSAGKKLKKHFANNQIWHFLGTDGRIYIWGSNTSGFGALGTPQNKTLTNYQAIPNLYNIIDMTYLTTFGFRRIGALSSSGEVYIWGVEDNNGSTTDTIYGDCTKTWKNTKNVSINYDMCAPIKITIENSNLSTIPNFKYIRGGIDAFIAKDDAGVYYRIRQEKSKKIEVDDIRNLIPQKWGYNSVDDREIISADISRTVNDLTNLVKISNGIVWINSKNELKGDIFISANENDEYFLDSIKKIKWKQIKVIDENNGMCGIDINNQMYCWGNQSYYRVAGSNQRYKVASTYFIPVFNTNLYDLSKDFMVAEAGDDYITPISSKEWQTTIVTQEGRTHSDAFFMKYPTYIGGFNYEFEFK